MKNIIKILFAALALVNFASCTEKGPGQNGNTNGLNENIEFTVKVLKVEGTTATIKVEHNGTEADTWYGFATTEKDMMEAYQKKVKELLKEGKITDLNTRASLTKQIKNLKPSTDYLYVVFGITEDGQIYGVPSSAEFTTGRNKTSMVYNDAWKVEYSGPNKILNKDYKYTATVTSSDKNKYFVTAYDKYTFEMADIADIAELELEYFRYSIDAHNEQNGTHMTIGDALFEGNGLEALNIIPGDWYAIAIGVDPEKGELSGLYAVSDLIQIPKETPTEEYSAWLGTWTWHGANGKTANVTFVEDNPNYTFYMLEWDGYDKESGPAISVEWSGEQNSWIIWPSFIGEAEFSMSDGSSAMGQLYIMGTYETSDGGKYYHGFDYPICAGGTDENGTKYTVGFEGENQNGEYTISMMEFIAFIQTSNGYSPSIATNTELPSFPATIVPATDEGENNGTTVPTSIRKTFRRAPASSKIGLPVTRQNIETKVRLK